MNEIYKNKLKKWEQDYLKAKKELLKQYPLNDNLSNNHPINKLQKEYWHKKLEIYKKYGKISTRK